MNSPDILKMKVQRLFRHIKNIKEDKNKSVRAQLHQENKVPTMMFNSTWT